MAHFVLGILIPLPCDDPLAYVEQAMKPYAGEANKTDGWRLIELQWSKCVDVIPYAYIALDGSWHQRAEGVYPEEEMHSQQIYALCQEHIAVHGFSHLDLLWQRIDEVPASVTDWHRAWQHVTHDQMSMVAFVWCHS